LYVYVTVHRSIATLNFRTIVHSGTPLLRVVYRDSESVGRLADNALTDVSDVGVAFFLVLFCKDFHDSRFQTLNGEIQL